MRPIRRRLPARWDTATTTSVLTSQSAALLKALVIAGTKIDSTCPNHPRPARTPHPAPAYKSAPPSRWCEASRYMTGRKRRAAADCRIRLYQIKGRLCRLGGACPRCAAGRADYTPPKSTLFVTVSAWVASPSWSHVPPFSGGTAVFVAATIFCPACWAVLGRTAGSASCRQPLA
jgi:hypothetical protein